MKKISILLIVCSAFLSGCSGLHQKNEAKQQPYPSRYYDNGTPQHNPTLDSHNSTLSFKLN